MKEHRLLPIQLAWLHLVYGKMFSFARHPVLMVSVEYNIYIISSIGTVTYNTAKELAKILKPLVGLSTHHVHNTKDFVEQLKDVRLKQGECIISYDVTALFPSVPIQPVVNIIQQKLANDKDLQQRTTMSIKHIISLLEFCIRSTHFVFQGQVNIMNR